MDQQGGDQPVRRLHHAGSGEDSLHLLAQGVDGAAVAARRCRSAARDLMPSTLGRSPVRARKSPSVAYMPGCVSPSGAVSNLAAGVHFMRI